jgi:hypothetical protein
MVLTGTCQLNAHDPCWTNFFASNYHYQDDTESEGNETAILTIPSAPQEVTLGATLSYTYTIIDNDTPAASGSYGTAIPQSTASVGGVPAGSVVVTPVVTAQLQLLQAQYQLLQLNLLPLLLAKFLANKLMYYTN